MDVYKPFVKYFVTPLWALKDRERYLFMLSKFEKSQYLSRWQLESYQFKKLRILLKHAYKNCPYYSNIFDDHGIDPGTVKSFSDFRKFPFLTKEDIQKNRDKLVAQNFPKELLKADKTGGSTGKPISYYRDRNRADMMKAVAIRHNRWAAQDIGDKIAAIWGHRLDLKPLMEVKGKIRNWLLDRTLVLDSSHITEEKMFQFATNLRRFKPVGYLAYANSMYEFARFLRKKGLRPPDSAKSIITSAEMLHPHERKLIEDVFGVNVFDRYGCREVGLIASECEFHSGLHIAADSVYVEVVNDEGKPAKNGEQGNIIITDLYNYGMPFIRYNIEDVGILSNKDCRCGRGLPLMEMVAGRATDFLITPEGVKVSGASITIYIIANTPGVSQAQFIQDKKDSVKLKIVRGKDFNDDSVKYLDKKLPEFFGGNMKIELDFVEKIPKEVSGKYRFSICNINQ